LSSSPQRRPTSTGYAILGLLAIKPWSTYELTKQMQQFSDIWPRAQSNLYAEPKRLVEAGLASAETQATGKRPRTLYTITDRGREALEQWLRAESGPSHYESETLLKVFFGNYGTTAELLANLREYRAEAHQKRALWAGVADAYSDGTHAFPQRAHINALIFRWAFDNATVNAQWADWAIEQVEHWPDTTSPAGLEQVLEIFRSR